MDDKICEFISNKTRNRKNPYSITLYVLFGQCSLVSILICYRIIHEIRRYPLVICTTLDINTNSVPDNIYINILNEDNHKQYEYIDTGTFVLKHGMCDHYKDTSGYISQTLETCLKKIDEYEGYKNIRNQTVRVLDKNYNL